MKLEGSTVMMVTLYTILIAGIIGWVMNITAIIHGGFPHDGLGIARIIGVFMAPLGAVLGYF